MSTAADLVSGDQEVEPGVAAWEYQPAAGRGMVANVVNEALKERKQCTPPRAAVAS